MVTGKKGLGKHLLVEAFSKRLLCLKPSDFGCEGCMGCNLFNAQTHPDYIAVSPSEPGKQIPVDAIRILLAKLALKAQYARRRVVVVEPAHALNVNAANSLLKSLEEPSPGTLIILVAERPSQLPATIVSRCQKLSVAMPPREEGLTFLKAKVQADEAGVLLNLAGGAPLAALALATDGVIARRKAFFDDWFLLGTERMDPITLSERWHALSVDEVLLWLTSWTEDLIRLSMVRDPVRLINSDLSAELKRLASRLNLNQLFGYWDRLLASRALMGGQLNRQLVLEEWMIHWNRVFQA